MYSSQLKSWASVLKRSIRWYRGHVVTFEVGDANEIYEGSPWWGSTRQREAISRVGLVSDIDNLISQKVAGLTTVAKLEGASPPKFNSTPGADPTVP